MYYDWFLSESSEETKLYKLAGKVHSSLGEGTSWQNFRGPSATRASREAGHLPGTGAQAIPEDNRATLWKGQITLRKL